MNVAPTTIFPKTTHLDKTPKSCYIPSSVNPNNDGISEDSIVLTVISIALFVSFAGSAVIAPFMKDDPAMGIKTSKGSAGVEYDHCKPAETSETVTFNDPATA